MPDTPADPTTIHEPDAQGNTAPEEPKPAPDNHDEPRQKRKYVWKHGPPAKNRQKSHIGTRGRGRKPTTPPKNPETAEAFQRILNRAKPKPPASIRQWAIAAEIQYETVLSWSRGETVPSVDMAIKLARAGKTTVEELFGHLATK